MPPTKKKKDKDEAAGALTLTLGDKTLPVPYLASLTLNETFAVLNQTGAKAETLWTVDIGKPYGRATLTAWWWIARSRETGTVLPISLIDAELTSAAERGDVLAVGFATGDPDPEA